MYGHVRAVAECAVAHGHRLRDITGDSENTLTLTYRKAKGDSDSLSALKTYTAVLTDSGWDVPTDGGDTATELGQYIDVDVTDENVLKLTVSIPSSISGMR
ncbi:hypothetical protein [Streptomyces sp. NPDC057675]|uniref:hypothetical protein n=1 Tax=Streptomyces sp. NPDC057675 TaxID=3346204 RepID=UPI00369A7162